MEKVVDVVTLIGKRGLSYRGSNEEAAYTLDNEEIDHGTFLEVVNYFGSIIPAQPIISLTLSRTARSNMRRQRDHEVKAP